MCLAIPGKIVDIQQDIDPYFRTGKVSFEGVLKNVNLSMVPHAVVGDYVLVHVGVALNKINEEEAKKTFEYLKEIGEIEDEIGPESVEL